MSDNLQIDIEKCLNHYSIDVEYWDYQAGDTNLMLGNRLFLQEHLNDLSQAQLALLQEIDQRVLALASVDYEIKEDEDDTDVVTLGWVADIVQGREIPQPNLNLYIRLNR